MNIDDKDREHEMDRWLDDALAQNGKAEPRPGLEGRVLARLAEARRESSRMRRWWSALAFTAAAILALVMVWRQRTEPSRTKPIANVATTQRADEHAAGNTRLPDKNANAARENHPLAIARNSSNLRALAVAAMQNAPKLEQFPAPQPLSEQEQLLARYVQEFPQKAALMARAQTELRKQDELEMAAPWPNASSTGLEQQE
jgi:hypothetical protein